MARTGWLNLEAGRNVVPEQVGTLFFEEDQAYKCLELSKKQRLQGFIGWYGPIPIECTLY
jgi:hypothetical protein